MKVAAIITEDFRLYHSLLREMRRLDIPHVSLTPGEEIPPYVGIVLSSEKEVDSIDFPVKIGRNDPERAASEALVYLSGTKECSSVLIGIDPGKRPGMAVVCDGKVVERIQARDPEDCMRVARNALRSRRYSSARIRIGDGDITNRNRVIAALYSLGVEMEMVDERNTTRYTKNDDIEAAISIAMTEGTKIEQAYEIEPTEGELREIQRRSRIISGNITIGKGLARRVAVGEMSMEDAIEEQRRGG